MPVPKNTRTDNPFTEHDDEERKPKPAANEDVERVETREPEEAREKVVSVDPPDEDDDDRDPTPRQQKRRARYDEQQRRADEAEDRARRAEAYAMALQAQHAVQPRERPADPLDEEEKRYDDDWKKHMALADTLSKSSTAEQQAQWKSDYLTLQKRSQTLAAKRAMAEAGIVPGQRVNHQEEAIKAHLQANFPEIAGVDQSGRPVNPQALMYADGVMRQKLARERRSAPTMKDYEDALSQTRRDLRLPGAVSPSPSQETRRKFSGTGLGGANGSTNGAREIRMTEAEMKMAEAMYKQERDKNGKFRKLKPEESHAKWAQKVGKKVLEERRSG